MAIFAALRDGGHFVTASRVRTEPNSADSINVDHPLIGTLREQSLHAALKGLYALPGDLVEVPVAGYVVDIVRPTAAVADGTADPLLRAGWDLRPGLVSRPRREGELALPGPGLMIEIQTGNFGALRSKLPVLLTVGPVRLVYPIARLTTVTVIDKQGEVLRVRRSPKRGTIMDVFAELVSIPEFCGREGLSIEVVLVDVDEVRRDGKIRRGRMRQHRIDRRLAAVGDRLILSLPEDYRRLAAAPSGSFTTADLAAAMQRPRWLAQKAAYCLRRMGVLKSVGFRARSVLYEAA